MIRPFTCVCMLLAGGAGLYLYQAKHTSQLLDREIARTVKQAETVRERAGVLRAEYTLLNDPQRLAELSGAHLASLRSTLPTQFTNWTEFEKRLPPVGAPAAEPPPPLEPEAPTAKLPEPKPDPKPEVKAEPKPEPTVEPRPEAPRPVAAARPVPAARPAAAQHAQTQPASPHISATPVSLSASLQPPPQRSSAPQPLARPAPSVALAAAPAPRPVTVSAMTSHPTPPPPRTMPTYTPPGFGSPAGYSPPGGSAGEAVARIARGAPMDPAVPAVASALGMARSMMAPPAPITPASAATIWQPTVQPTGQR